MHMFTLSRSRRALTTTSGSSPCSAPSAVTADEQFPVEAHVYSQFETTAHSRAEEKRRTSRLEDRTVLLPGLNRIAFETRVKDESERSFSPRMSRPADDPLAENNSFRQPVVVNGRPRILYVESHAPSVQYLQKALTSKACWWTWRAETIAVLGGGARSIRCGHSERRRPKIAIRCSK